MNKLIGRYNVEDAHVNALIATLKALKHCCFFMVLQVAHYKQFTHFHPRCGRSELFVTFIWK